MRKFDTFFPILYEILFDDVCARIKALLFVKNFGNKYFINEKDQRA